MGVRVGGELTGAFLVLINKNNDVNARRGVRWRVAIPYRQSVC